MDLHAHLRHIAHFQSQVVSLAPQVSQLENDLASTSSSKAAFPHLYRLRNLPFAYSASVVEIVRRKEYGQFLSEWTSKLKEVLTRFTSTENTRRLKIREDVISHLPFTLPALDDSMRVGVELSVSNGLEVLKGVVLERKDVDGKRFQRRLYSLLICQVCYNGSNRFGTIRKYWAQSLKVIWAQSGFWRNTLVF